MHELLWQKCCRAGLAPAFLMLRFPILSSSESFFCPSVFCVSLENRYRQT
jgi:hypothetical protein